MTNGEPSASRDGGVTRDDAIQVRDRWESATRWPLIALSIAFLVAYSILVLARDAPDGLRWTLIAVLAVSWAVFIADIVLRAVLTPRHARWSYLRHHRIDLASAVIPLMRPFQLLRYLRLTPGFMGNSGNALRSRVIAYAAVYAGMFVYVVALTVLAVERSAPHATIRSFGDAIWWACVTLATVGYGDYTPVTGIGRMLAVALMVGGVAIVGSASAIIVSYLFERVARPEYGPYARPRDRK
jgi:voltage-gated potassium channel